MRVSLVEYSKPLFLMGCWQRVPRFGVKFTGNATAYSSQSQCGAWSRTLNLQFLVAQGCCEWLRVCRKEQTTEVSCFPSKTYGLAQSPTASTSLRSSRVPFNSLLSYGLSSSSAAPASASVQRVLSMLSFRFHDLVGFVAVETALIQVLSSEGRLALACPQMKACPWGRT